MDSECLGSGSRRRRGHPLPRQDRQLGPV